VTQVGRAASHLGRIDLTAEGARAEALELGDDVPPHPAVLAAAAAIEPEVEATLAEPVGQLYGPLDPEAGARWLAELLRRRMGAEVGIVAPGQAFTTGLPGGVLTRDALWSAVDSTANPGVVAMRGEQLAAVLARGRDEELARTSALPLRGRPRGVLQVSGDGAVDPAREYLVAGTDWELEPYGGLVEEAWALRPRYEFPTILREVIEEHLATGGR
jgi:2',3'-cyclic-nucleotide 2'-phosphodiesterase (5'-nucleotidase family)